MDGVLYLSWLFFFRLLRLRFGLVLVETYRFPIPLRSRQLRLLPLHAPIALKVPLLTFLSPFLNRALTKVVSSLLGKLGCRCYFASSIAIPLMTAYRVSKRVSE